MAQELKTRSGSIYRPGAYPEAEAVTNPSALSTNGVIILVGEADGGPDYTAETDLSQNYYGSTQFAALRAKYRRGPVVKAAFAAMNPSGDDRRRGAPARIYVVKTNPSVKARSTLSRYDTTTYHTLADRNYGISGNSIYYKVTASVSESHPSIGPFTLLVPNNTTAVSLRTNGGAVLTAQLAAADLPTTTVTALNGLSGIGCTGGTNRSVITVSGTLAVAVSRAQATFTPSLARAPTPTVGDSLYVPSGSAIQGGTNKNRGSYVVTAVTSTTIVATKLLDSSGAAGAVTNPEVVSATSIVDVSDLMAFAPVTLTQDSADPVDGYGKSLEFNELTSSTGRLSDLCYDLSTTKVTWVSKTGAPKMVTSTAEYVAKLDVYRQSDQLHETITAGGNVALKIGYTGTTATLTVTPTGLTTSVSGGSGANLAISFGSVEDPEWPTLKDLADHINAQTGYTCTIGSAALGQKTPFHLDEVSAVGICTTFGNATGRIKVDAQDFWERIGSTSSVQLGLTTAADVPASSGLPAPNSTYVYLTSGAKGATTDAIVSSALDACKKLRTNFLVTCFSRDASADVTDGLTDSSSTYTIDGINQAAKTHAIAQSTMRLKRHRIALCGKRSTYSAAKTAAAELATNRVVLAFQDVKHLGDQGSVVQDHPYVTAALVAGFQAAAFTRGVVARTPNLTGAVQAANDFDDLDVDQVDDALKAGLLVIGRDDDDQWVVVSDQTSYSKDSHWLNNSIQATYVSDLIQLSVAKAVQRAVVGETPADMDATLARTVVQASLDEMRAIGAIAPSAGAPPGYRRLNVRLSGGVVYVDVDVFVATVNYFVKIKFNFNQVEDSASG